MGRVRNNHRESAHIHEPSKDIGTLLFIRDAAGV